MNLLNLIRSKTGALHTSLHTHPLLIHLNSESITDEIFGRIIEKFYGFHSSIIADLKEHDFSKPYRVLFDNTIANLKHDLALLHMSPFDIKGYDAEVELNTEEAMWAYLYLLLGSSLGGNVIHKSLIKNLSIYNSQYTFFQGANNASYTWKNFIATLENNTLNLEHEKIAAAAQRLFAGLYIWMEE